jgi:anti-sigma28 factor (negative regulator of flagellin synthesis)
MEKLELLQQFFAHRMERIQEEGAPDRGRSRKQTLRDRMQDPAVAEALNLARSAMRDIPEVRQDLVESFKEQWKAGTLLQDASSLADRLLEDAVLNELL